MQQQILCLMAHQVKDFAAAYPHIHSDKDARDSVMKLFVSEVDFLSQEVQQLSGITCASGISGSVEAPPPDKHKSTILLSMQYRFYGSRRTDNAGKC
jgi:hypothetical protein